MVKKGAGAFIPYLRHIELQLPQESQGGRGASVRWIRGHRHRCLEGGQLPRHAVAVTAPTARRKLEAAAQGNGPAILSCTGEARAPPL